MKKNQNKIIKINKKIVYSNNNNVDNVKDKKNLMDENLTYKQLIDKFVGEEEIELL